MSNSQQRTPYGPKYKYDNLVTATMIEDMLFDPVLAAKVLLDVDIPPHQELRLLTMWTNHFSMDDSGFSTGKSFTAAVCMALRSMLIPNRISGVLSGTFRQGKLIFSYFDKWYRNSKIFRSTIKHQGGKPKITHGQEVHEIFFKGGSTCRVLPPNLLQDSQRLRSERWHDGYFDEWTTYGNYKTLTSTMFGRVTAVGSGFDSCPVRGNHIHCMSTPDYTYNPAYEVVEKIESQISSGQTGYARFTSNYRHVPMTRKWRKLVDLRTIRLMQDTNPRGVTASEIDGLWQDDSESYYSSKEIEISRMPTWADCIARYLPSDIYVAGFDVARGMTDAAKRQDGDDFSIVVIRIPIDGIPYPCYAKRYTGLNADQMSGIVHDTHLNFGLSVIVFDPGGGGLFVRDVMLKQTQQIRGDVIAATPIVEFLDNSGVIGDPILHAFRRSSHFIKQIWGTMASDSVLVNRLHAVMKSSIESGEILLPSDWGGDGYDAAAHVNDPDVLRSFLNKNRSSLTDVSLNRAELALAVKQLTFVDIDRNRETGAPKLDSHGMFKFKSRSKKDSAYAMCYANIARKIQQSSGFSGNRSSGDSSFPISISSL